MKSEMSRAKKLALGNYPPKYVGILDENATPAIDMNENARAAYIEGYEQAEKDLALTWQDIAHLNAMVGMLTKQEFKGNVFEEVLRRFNENTKVI